jgi:hypothetical protein
VFANLVFAVKQNPKHVNDWPEPAGRLLRGGCNSTLCHCRNLSSLFFIFPLVRLLASPGIFCLFLTKDKEKDKDKYKYKQERRKREWHNVELHRSTASATTPRCSP